MNLQDLMDKAWYQAVQQLNLTEVEELNGTQIQRATDLQTKIFQDLGGDLEAYYEQTV